MAKSKLVKVNEKIADEVVSDYKKIEDGVVSTYKKIEDGFVDGFNKISDRFVENYLTKDGESVDEAKVRLNQEKNKELKKENKKVVSNKL